MAKKTQSKPTIIPVIKHSPDKKQEGGVQNKQTKLIETRRVPNTDEKVNKRSNDKKD